MLMAFAGQQMESSGQSLALGVSHQGRGEWARAGEEVDGGRWKMGRDVPPQLTQGIYFC